jgi:glutamate racemase
MQQNSTAPIGIFDSGIGGLTVAHSIKDILPNEKLIYFGDTAHLPYGDKSTAAIQAYSVKIADLLIQQGCKVIVIACNSASAAAYELLQEYTASRAKVINVIDPMVQHLAAMRDAGEVGIIGTRRTIATNIYPKKLQEQNGELVVKQLATPLLVPMIEEGFIHDRISHDIIDRYLSNENLQNISRLILGCTHYPLIKEEIVEYFQNKVEVLDSSLITAGHLQAYLENNQLLNKEEHGIGDRFFVSDYTESFEVSARHFFGGPVQLDFHKLWE